MSSDPKKTPKPRTQLVPAPPVPFPTDIRIETTLAGLVLHRIHRDQFAGDSFNPSETTRNRFSPIKDAAEKVVSVLYAGGTIPCAYYETLFHDHVSASGIRVMNRSDLEDRRYSAIRVDRPLRLASLFAPDLARLNLTLDQLIHCKAFHYRRTARWAEAINRELVDVDGLVWTSYRGDPDAAYVLFGNRSVQASLTIVRSAASFLDELDLRKELHQCAARLGVRLNLSHAPSPAAAVTVPAGDPSDI